MNIDEIAKSTFKANTNNIAARVVNIIGRAPSAGVILPYGENWGVNHAWHYGHTLSKLFIMDGVKAMFSCLASERLTEEQFIEYITDNPDVSFINAYPEGISVHGKEIKQCEVYPLNLAAQLLPGNFFNNSIVWMLVYAALQEKLGFKKVDIINLLGVELWFTWDGSEYTDQKPCLDFWIPYLYGMGIQLYIPAYCIYAKGLKSNMYGYIR